jgi:hypothetical protein
LHSLNFIQEADELVVSGVGGFRIWTFIQEKSLHSTRIIVEDLNADEWVTKTYYLQCGQIYAVYDNNVNVC